MLQFFHLQACHACDRVKGRRREFLWAAHLSHFCIEQETERERERDGERSRMRGGARKTELQTDRHH